LSGPKAPLKEATIKRCVMMQKYLLGEIDFKFDIRCNSSFHSYQTRRSNDLHLPGMRTSWGKQTFIYQASKDWKNLDNDIKNSKSLSSFKAKLKTLSIMPYLIVNKSILKLVLYCNINFYLFS